MTSPRLFSDDVAYTVQLLREPRRRLVHGRSIRVAPGTARVPTWCGLPARRLMLVGNVAAVDAPRLLTCRRCRQGARATLPRRRGLLETFRFAARKRAA